MYVFFFSAHKQLRGGRGHPHEVLLFDTFLPTPFSSAQKVTCSALSSSPRSSAKRSWRSSSKRVPKGSKRCFSDSSPRLTTEVNPTYDTFPRDKECPKTPLFFQAFWCLLPLRILAPSKHTTLKNTVCWSLGMQISAHTNPEEKNIKKIQDVHPGLKCSSEDEVFK